MTHILQQDQPKTGFVLIKKNIRTDDTIIFQSQNQDQETSVKVSTVINGDEQKGLMKGYVIAGWIKE